MSSELPPRLVQYLERAGAAKTIPAPHIRISGTEATVRSKELLAVLQLRRTIRHYSSEPVPWALIENAVRAAATSPSGANQQPWSFVIVEDQQTKRQLREAIEREEYETYAHRASDEWLDALAPLGTDFHKEHITTAPYVAVVFAQAYGLRTDAGGTVRKVKHYYVSESVGIATGFFIASLTCAGLSTLTHTPNPMGFLRDILGRPDNERAYVVIPIGYAADDACVPDIRKKPLRRF